MADLKHMMSVAEVMRLADAAAREYWDSLPDETVFGEDCVLETFVAAVKWTVDQMFSGFEDSSVVIVDPPERPKVPDLEVVLRRMDDEVNLPRFIDVPSGRELRRMRREKERQEKKRR